MCVYVWTMQMLHIYVISEGKSDDDDDDDSSNHNYMTYIKSSIDLILQLKTFWFPYLFSH